MKVYEVYMTAPYEGGNTVLVTDSIEQARDSFVLNQVGLWHSHTVNIKTWVNGEVVDTETYYPPDAR